MSTTAASAVAAKPARQAGTDDLAFQPSAHATLGVELELQILDQESGDLTAGAVPLLQACAAAGINNVSAELMQSMIELKTTICADVAAAQAQLLPPLAKLRNIATSLGFNLAMAGTHPFHRTSTSAVFPAERYERIMDRLAWLTYQRVVFGLHVHVGVPGGDQALGVSNMLTQYLPHLLALSASSPFWQGVDTGLQSARAALYRLLPHSGVPHFFSNWKQFRGYCNVMRDTGAIKSFKDIYWDIRPRPDLGTIEFRICDMPGTLRQALGLVALTRALVVSGLRLLEERPRLLRGDVRRNWLAPENNWLASRYGLEAMYIRTPGGKRGQLGQEVANLLDRLRPVADELGDGKFLAALKPGENYESDADRQRRLFRETGDWKAVIGDLTQRLGEELRAAEPAAASAGR